MARRTFVPLDITDHFSLVMVWNRGVSFGMLSAGDDAVRWGLTVFALAVAAGLVVWMSGLADRLQTFAAGLVAGGAIGNAIDRIVLRRGRGLPRLSRRELELARLQRRRLGHHHRRRHSRRPCLVE